MSTYAFWTEFSPSRLSSSVHWFWVVSVQKLFILSSMVDIKSHEYDERSFWKSSTFSVTSYRLESMRKLPLRPRSGFPGGSEGSSSSISDFHHYDKFSLVATREISRNFENSTWEFWPWFRTFSKLRPTFSILSGILSVFQKAAQWNPR